MVGPGLPLIKRLLLLKAKEERLAKESTVKVRAVQGGRFSGGETSS